MIALAGLGFMAISILSVQAIEMMPSTREDRRVFNLHRYSATPDTSANECRQVVQGFIAGAVWLVLVPGGIALLSRGGKFPADAAEREIYWGRWGLIVTAAWALGFASITTLRGVRRNRRRFAVAPSGPTWPGPLVGESLTFDEARLIVWAIDDRFPGVFFYTRQPWPGVPHELADEVRYRVHARSTVELDTVLSVIGRRHPGAFTTRRLWRCWS